MKKHLLLIIVISSALKASPHEKSTTESWLNTVRFESLKAIKKLTPKSRINARDARGNTALHWAILYRGTAVARYLIKNGAAVNAPNNEGESPLHFATHTNDTKKISLLLNKGANWQAANSENQNASDCANEGSRQLIEVNTQCAICTDQASFINHTNTKCNHIFCTDCIDEWLAFQIANHNNGTCPKCRTTLINNPQPTHEPARVYPIVAHLGLANNQLNPIGAPPRGFLLMQQARFIHDQN